MFSLILVIDGMIAVGRTPSLRGKIPRTMIVALGAFSRMVSSNALIPLVISAASASLAGVLPRLLVPASKTMTLG